MEKVKKLKQTFNKEKIDGYIIPKNDEFFDEYPPYYNDRLNYITNFSGSYGFSVILKKQNYLFVDGRYTLQANKQSGSLFKIITIPNLMPADIFKRKRYLIGYDPKLFTKRTLNIFSNKNVKLKAIKNNLIDKIWKRKLKKNRKKFYCLPKNSVGENYHFKISKVTNNLKNKNADYQLITSSENNAWLFNIRGEDSKYSPLPHCYTIINKNKNVKFFCDLKKISSSFRKKFKNTEFFEI